MSLRARAAGVTSSDVSGSVSNDVALADAIAPKDTISCLRWSPVANHLAASSWDNMVRIYDVANDGTCSNVASMTADGPLFSCHFQKVSHLSI